jgi:hypothetical protein
LQFGKKGTVRKIPVNLCARLTEIGTLDLSCYSRRTEHRWRLQFNIRPVHSERTEDKKQPREKKTKDAMPGESTQRALKILSVAFSPEKPRSDHGVTPATVVKALHDCLGTNKENWPVPVLRRLADALLRGLNHRKISPRHEERWLNLSGFCLRPGYGDTGDDYRIRQIIKIYQGGVIFPRDLQCRVEWWILWRRVVGGLNEKQQMALFRDLFPLLLSEKKSEKKHRRATPQERAEMWRTLANLERLPIDHKEEIGKALIKQMGTCRGEGLNMWVLSRIGTRIPLYGPLNSVVPARTVTDWIEQTLKAPWKKPAQTAFSVVQMASFTGDRERDIEPSLRDRIRERLQGLEDGERLAQRLCEMVPLNASEQDRVFGEGLPGGLHLAE